MTRGECAGLVDLLLGHTNEQISDITYASYYRAWREITFAKCQEAVDHWLTSNSDKRATPAAVIKAGPVTNLTYYTADDGYKREYFAFMRSRGCVAEYSDHIQKRFKTFRFVKKTEGI